MAKAAKKKGETPLMKQYNQIKGRYPDAILLFRVGDFYETFGEDARRAAAILDIVLTKRSNGSAADTALAGFPHHALDSYLPKLVRAGERVAICDQLEDPKQTKGIVKRGVTELVTPGVSYHDKTFDSKANNYLAAVCIGKDIIGVSFLDISTGEFLLAEGSSTYIDKILNSFQPSEVLVSRSHFKQFVELFGEQYFTTRIEDWVSSEDHVQELLLSQFDTLSLKGFGVEQYEMGQKAAAMALFYFKETQHNKVDHIKSLNRIESDQFVWLDKFTIRNLEIFQSSSAGGTALIDVLDHTSSAMGSRLLRRWLAFPLKKLNDIQGRHEAVAAFLDDPDCRLKTKSYFGKIGDLDRLATKVATGRIQPRELQQLGNSLQLIPEIQELFKKNNSSELRRIASLLNPLMELAQHILTHLTEEAPVNLSKGHIIAEGISNELDELRGIAGEGKSYLKNLQERESERTGIPSLKIAYNNVFGYYLEVRNTHKDKVPEEWVRKQTLVNAERYITEELKEYEQKILGAEDRITELEQGLYFDLVELVSKEIEAIQKNGQLLAQIDCLLSFAEVAVQNNYAQPILDESHALDIKEGRHPVIEKQLPPGKPYISNDVYLDREEQQILIITGPNMAGKSALLRQTALICVMAQIGCFVPASEAKIGLVDKIFTRVGASDNISQGESTFMVEMNETASILNNLSDRSLVLLDEIGRGTSTYDGISIAWAIAEFLHEHPAKAKTLFATHYHELNDLSLSFERIKNYNVTVKEHKEKVIFLRKLEKGGSEHSFGIHVAQMAGMPEWVVAKSKQLLKDLEKKSARKQAANGKTAEEEMQLSIFKLDDPVLEKIRDEIETLDINVLTPVEALMKLNEIKKMVSK